MSVVEVPAAPSRCAVHPARPAAGPCPTCHRPRCAADAAVHDDRCAACAPARPQGRSPARLERLVRAGLACQPVVLLGGWIATQYWHDRFFSWAIPALVGFAAAAAAVTAAGRMGLGLLWAVPAGVVAVALSYSFVPGGAGLVTPPAQTLPPYLAAVLGALAWYVVGGTGRAGPAARGLSGTARRR